MPGYFRRPSPYADVPFGKAIQTPFWFLAFVHCCMMTQPQWLLLRPSLKNATNQNHSELDKKWKGNRTFKSIFTGLRIVAIYPSRRIALKGGVPVLNQPLKCFRAFWCRPIHIIVVYQYLNWLCAKANGICSLVVGKGFCETKWAWDRSFWYQRGLDKIYTTEGGG